MIAKFRVSFGDVELLLLETYFVEIARLTKIDQIIARQGIDGMPLGIGKDFMASGRATTQTHAITGDANAAVEDEITVDHRIIIDYIDGILGRGSFDILRL